MVRKGDRTMRPDDTPTKAQRPVTPAARRRPRARVERAEERLVPKITRQEAGRVAISKTTVRQRDRVELAVTHDEIDLERRSVNRPLAEGEQPVAEVGDETVVLVVEERLEVRKVPWVVEEIHVRRRLVSKPQTVTGSVRKERVDVSTTGDVVLDNR
jgi:uncharacterized protein (TIGR02271 family)